MRRNGVELRLQDRIVSKTSFLFSNICANVQYGKIEEYMYCLIIDHVKSAMKALKSGSLYDSIYN